MAGQKGTEMEKAQVTVKRLGEDLKTWVIPAKHLWALEDFLSWAQKQDTLEKKRTTKMRRSRELAR